MSNESMIETIKAELDNADHDTLSSVLKTLSKSKKIRSSQRKKQDSRGSSTHAKTSKSNKFIGENLTFEEIKKLTRKERAALQWRIKEQNRKWLEQKYNSLKALWVMVIDGEVYSWGGRRDYPQAEKIDDIIKRTGKYPFVFTDDKRLLIEESGSNWHKVDETDYYPTIPLALKSGYGSTDIIADFDTGSPYSFVNHELLLEKQVVQDSIKESVERAIHLGKLYEYSSKNVFVEFVTESGVVKSSVAPIYCVADWRDSPFVKINPFRVALIGRDLLFELKVNVLLEFENNRTKIIE